MNRGLISATVGLAVVVGMMLSMQQVLSADQAVVNKNSGECGLLGADEFGDMSVGGVGVIITQIENDRQIIFKCKGEGITNLSGAGQHIDGFPCGLTSGENSYETEDTHATVSASGVATLTCRFNK